MDFDCCVKKDFGRAGLGGFGVGGVAAVPSIKDVSVEAAVLDGFKEMVRFDAFGTGEIGNRPCDFENAVVGARGETELLHCMLKQIAEGSVDRAVFADLRLIHAGV